MTSTERFIALIVGIVAILGGLGGALQLLSRISYRTGQVVTRMDEHLIRSGESHRDYEARLRELERRRR